MTKHVRVIANVFNIPFEIEGEYEPYIPARHGPGGDPGDPPEGGYFDDYTISLGGIDISELCEEVAFINIVRSAECGAGRKQIGEYLSDRILREAESKAEEVE